LLFKEELLRQAKNEKKLKEQLATVKLQLKSEKRVSASLRKKVKTVTSLRYRSSLIKNEFLSRFSAPKTNFFLRRNKRAKQWTEPDIIDALTLRGFSKRAYQFLRKKQLLPLPGLSTLRNWVKNFKCYPGIQNDLLKVLETKLSGELPDDYRDAILSFDEMSIKNCYEYHHGQDKVYGPHKKLQLVVLRGLFHKWKLQVFYAFDTPMNKKLLFELITEIEKHKAIIRGASADLGNHTVLSQLGLTKDQPWFQHPTNSTRKIFFFPDAPHLLKLLRNHLIDQGLQWSDGTKLEKKDFENLLEKDGNEKKILPRLTQEHIYCKNNARQRVRMAAQLLSHSTATAMKTLFPSKAREADFIELVDSW
jgi:hypothetical protein